MQALAVASFAVAISTLRAPPQLFSHTAFPIIGADAFKPQTALSEGWNVPLLLPSLLSPAADSWRRAAGVQTPEASSSSSLFEQLPHFGPALATDDGLLKQSEEEPVEKRPPTIYRDQYQPPAFDVESIELTLKLDEENTQVYSMMRLHRRPGGELGDLVLDGDSLQLHAVHLNGHALSANPTTGYVLEEEGKKLRIPMVLLPANEAPFELQLSVAINPKANLELMGLYLSEETFVTQCEPTGFRRITYFLDRPDVLTRYRVRLEADKEKYPVLLSNGNKLAQGPLPEDPSRHFAVFEDPFAKPSYLFAVVAGNLAVLRDSFLTMGGREVTLQLFASSRDVEKLELPRDILKQSMRFDEERFGREYDLDVLNVVCVNNFNAGAMENKGLLIFNCDVLLADPATTTDFTYSAVVSVVAHEYFHNWTGNRVTVRDWFEISLKEGLTTFREELFSAAVGSAAVTRINKMKLMVGHQFKEDAGPLAHPVRPDSYMAVNNLYTFTVYEKGAEILRMYQTLLGVYGFRKGMDLYFERHDGTAVTADDFRAAMEDANHVDLSQIALWYSQAGTPHVKVERAEYNPETKVFSITLTQRTPPTPGQPYKKPLMIPVKIGLIGKESKKDLFQPPTKVVVLKEDSLTVDFFNVNEDCVPSFLRDFSAPVKLLYEQTPEELAFLMAHDSDPVNKWLAAQKLASSIILARADLLLEDASAQFQPLPAMFVDALRTTLLDKETDRFVKALTLRLPELPALEQEVQVADPEFLHRARKSVIMDIAAALKQEMLEVYASLTVNEVERFDQQSLGRRRLRNELLMILSAVGDREAAVRAFKHFSDARCLTDKFYSLTSLADMQQPERDLAFAKFYDEAGGDAQLLDYYFRLQALSDLPDQVERVEELLSHPDFTLTNPNRLRSLLTVFARHSPHFHRKDGRGYTLIADVILKVDKLNSHSAAGLASLLSSGRNLTEDRKELIQQQLKRILAEPQLSNNVKDIVLKAVGES
ncbi:hypothetical protein Efla_006367 [Eimeria flavescens]